MTLTAIVASSATRAVKRLWWFREDDTDQASFDTLASPGDVCFIHSQDSFYRKPLAGGAAVLVNSNSLDLSGVTTFDIKQTIGSLGGAGTYTTGGITINLQSIFSTGIHHVSFTQEGGVVAPLILPVVTRNAPAVGKMTVRLQDNTGTEIANGTSLVPYSWRYHALGV